AEINPSPQSQARHFQALHPRIFNFAPKKGEGILLREAKSGRCRRTPEIAKEKSP
ncbi:hypothetical protein FRC00_011325, partial [Tulasnella sp. 408]